jgi:hypothetical protein
MSDNPTGTPKIGASRGWKRAIALISPIKGPHGGRETVEQKMFLTILLNTILL